MAKVQTRRTISLNHALWELIHEHAQREGESAAQFVTRAVRARLRRGGATLPKQKFAGPAVHGRTNHRGAVRS